MNIVRQSHGDTLTTSLRVVQASALDKSGLIFAYCISRRMCRFWKQRQAVRSVMRTWLWGEIEEEKRRSYVWRPEDWGYNLQKGFSEGKRAISFINKSKIEQETSQSTAQKFPLHIWKMCDRGQWRTGIDSLWLKFDKTIMSLFLPSEEISIWVE